MKQTVKIKSFYKAKARIIFLFLFYVVISFVWCNATGFFKTNLVFDVHTDCPNSIVTFFWYSGANIDYPFDDDHCEYVGISNGGASVIYPLDLDITGGRIGLSHLRMDFSDKPYHNWYIDRIYSKSITAIIDFPIEDCLQIISEKNEIDVNYDSTNKSLCIYTKGNDPYLTLSGIGSYIGIPWYTRLINKLLLFITVLLISILLTVFTRIIFVSAHYKPENRFSVFLKLVICGIEGFICAIVFDRLILYAVSTLVYRQGFLLSQYLSNIFTFSFARICFWSIWAVLAIGILNIGVDNAIKYRYLISIILLAFLVCGKYNGQSYGFLSGMFMNYEDSYVPSTLLGVNQGLRGDTWSVELPLSLAQVNSRYPLRYHNYGLSLDGNDALVSGQLPNNDIMMITLPLKWGYFFLPPEYAISFNWWLSFIILFLSSFEMIYGFTGNERSACAFAFLITFSPCVMWWDNSIIKIIVGGQCSIVCLHYFLNTSNKKKKIAFFIGGTVAFLSFVFTLYPAWIIPFGYVFLIMAIFEILQCYRNKKLVKTDIFSALLFGGVVVLFSIRFILLSKNAIIAQMSTVYPGKHKWLAVPEGAFLLQIINFFMSFFRYTNIENNSEIAQFYDMFIWVVLLILFSYKTVVKTKNKKLIITLLVYCIVLLAVMFTGEHETLYSLTLLSFTYPRRLLPVFGYISNIILMLLLNDKEIKLKKNVAWIISALIFISIIIMLLTNGAITDYFEGHPLLIILAVGIVILWTYFGYNILCHRKVEKTLLVMAFVTVISTVWACPIQSGLGDWKDSSLIAAVNRLKNDSSNGRWMVSDDVTIANFVAACGTPRVCGTYVYPDLEMKKIIDPNNEFDFELNRYSHFDISISDHNEFTALGTYVFGTIDVVTAKELNVQYWVTTEEKDQLAGVTLRKCYSDGQWNIYELTYID